MPAVNRANTVRFSASVADIHPQPHASIYYITAQNDAQHIDANNLWVGTQRYVC